MSTTAARVDPVGVDDSGSLLDYWRTAAMVWQHELIRYSRTHTRILLRDESQAATVPETSPKASVAGSACGAGIARCFRSRLLITASSSVGMC